MYKHLVVDARASLVTALCPGSSSWFAIVAGTVWLLVAPALASDMTRISLPASDLVTSAKPYVLTVQLDNSVTAETIRVAVQLRRNEEGATAEPVTGMTNMAIRQTLATSAAPSSVKSDLKKFEIAIHATDLAEGEYTGEVTLAWGTWSQKQPISFFRMPQDKPADFPYGVYAVNFPPTVSQRDALMKQIRATGLNFMALNHMHQMGGLSAVFDRAARQGVQFIPAVNTVRETKSIYDMTSRLANGAKRGHCLNQPDVRRCSAEALAALIRHYQTHPAFSGKVYFGDDFTLPLTFTNGFANMACYCDYCRQQFQALTGAEPPLTPTNAVIGVVPTDNLWLRWMRYRCGDIFGGFMKELEAAKNRVDPSVALAQIHGWSEQPFTRVDVGVYPPLSQTVSVLSSYSYPNLRMQRKDLISHFELAKMGHRDKDVWMLGLLAMNNTAASPLQIRQNYWNQLAGGFRLISYFSWVDLTKALAAGETNRFTAAVEALTQCGRHKDWILPAVPYWHDPEASNAVLYSFSTESFDAPHEGKNKYSNAAQDSFFDESYEAPSEGGGIRHLRKIMGFLHEAMAQHVPMKVMAEEEIVTPETLRALTSLSLCDVRVLPANVYQAIEAYAAAGGRVYLDMDSRINIKGARRMSVETMVALAGDCAPGQTKVSSPLVTVREFPGGPWASYYVFVNNAADRYWGLPFNYRLPQGNYDQDALVRDDPVTSAVEFRRKDRWLFDMFTGQPLGSTKAPLALTLEPSWGMVVCALPSPSAKLLTTAPKGVRLGEVARIRLAMEDDHQQPLDAAFVAKVDVTCPSGRVSRYSRYMGFQQNGEFALPIGMNDETGQWTISIEGGFPRQKTTIRLMVTEANRSPENLVSVR